VDSHVSAGKGTKMRWGASGGYPRSRMLVIYIWLTVVMLLTIVYGARQLTREVAGQDFSMFLTGARILTSGHAADLYSLTLQTTVEENINGRAVATERMLPFNYPPYVAVFFSPLTLFAPTHSYYIWLAVQWIILALLAFSIMYYFREQYGFAAWILVAALLSFAPIHEALLLGQMSIVLLALWWWAFVSWRHERWAQLGVAVALSAFKPQLAVLLLVGMLVQKRWKALGIAAATQAVLWAGAMLLGGPQLLYSYLDMLRVSSSSINTLGFFGNLMVNLRGLLTISGVDPALSLQISMAFWVLSIGVAAWLWRRPWSIAARFGATAILAVLLSPHLYPHDASLLILAFACGCLAYLEHGLRPNPAWLVIPIAAMYVGIYSPLYADALGITSYSAPLVLATWFTGAATLLWLVRAERMGWTSVAPAMQINEASAGES
jgi:hypothetical protein